MDKSAQTKVQNSSYLTLLVCLIGLAVVNPFTESSRDPMVTDVVTSMVLFAGLWSIYHNKKVVWVAAILLLPAFAGRWCYMYWHSEELVFISAASTAAFMLFNCYAILTYILHQREPRPDTIYGGICIYLFLGFLWCELYVITELLNPGAFSMTQEGLSPTAIRGELNYFSFVTLATLGYGEITPVSDMARTLAVIEAVVGQMFVAVYIARLVGFHLVAKE